MDSEKEEGRTGAINDVELGDGEETARVVDHRAERQLCRKLDIRILPMLSIMCKH